MEQKNMPQVNMGIVGVRRDGFPMEPCQKTDQQRANGLQNIRPARHEAGERVREASPFACKT